MASNHKETTSERAASREVNETDLSRRRFIRTATVGAASAALLNTVPDSLDEATRALSGGSNPSVMTRTTEMKASEFHESRKFISTSFGRIAYVERGSGPVALFIHGWPLNGYPWRDIITNLSDTHRCIALDTMGLGHTEVSPDQNLALPEQALMAEAFIDALKIDRIDLVGMIAEAESASSSQCAHPIVSARLR